MGAAGGLVAVFLAVCDRVGAAAAGGRVHPEFSVRNPV